MALFDVYNQYPIELVSAKGMQLKDSKGSDYLDFYGGHAVISIGHTHPHYVNQLKSQIDAIGFYSNVIHNPLQEELAKRINAKLEENYELFLCSSGAEANENALKLASFHTERSKILAFSNAFHGRTSAAVAATHNTRIQAPINKSHQVDFIDFNDVEALKNHLETKNYAAVIIECIQGVGGLDQPDADFVRTLRDLCTQTGTVLIADEVQSGFSRTGRFFSFQHYNIIPDIISMAKGMGNGFPVGGIMIHESIKAQKGMLGTTFGGNYLACTAALSVMDVLEKENLEQNAATLESVFRTKAAKLQVPAVVKGRGLMIGLEFDFNTAELRRNLLFQQGLFVGSASNPNVLRILPPLCCTERELNQLFEGLNQELKHE